MAMGLYGQNGKSPDKIPRKKGRKQASFLAQMQGSGDHNLQYLQWQDSQPGDSDSDLQAYGRRDHARRFWMG
jgi:hypothetical protein